MASRSTRAKQAAAAATPTLPAIDELQEEEDDAGEQEQEEEEQEQQDEEETDGDDGSSDEPGSTDEPSRTIVSAPPPPQPKRRPNQKPPQMAPRMDDPLSKVGLPRDGQKEITKAKLTEAGAIDSESVIANARMRHAIENKMQGKRVLYNGPGWQKYNQAVQEFGQTCKVHLEQIDPTEAYIDELQTSIVPNHAALVARIKRDYWDGGPAVYRWTMTQNGSLQRGTDTITFKEDPRQRAEWEKKIAADTAPKPEVNPEVAPGNIQPPPGMQPGRELPPGWVQTPWGPQQWQPGMPVPPGGYNPHFSATQPGQQAPAQPPAAAAPPPPAPPAAVPTPPATADPTAQMWMGYMHQQAQEAARQKNEAEAQARIERERADAERDKARALAEQLASERRACAAPAPQPTAQAQLAGEVPEYLKPFIERIDKLQQDNNQIVQTLQATIEAEKAKNAAAAAAKPAAIPGAPQVIDTPFGPMQFIPDAVPGQAGVKGRILTSWGPMPWPPEPIQGASGWVPGAGGPVAPPAAAAPQPAPAATEAPAAAEPAARPAAVRHAEVLEPPAKSGMEAVQQAADLVMTQVKQAQGLLEGVRGLLGSPEVKNADPEEVKKALEADKFRDPEIVIKDEGGIKFAYNRVTGKSDVMHTIFANVGKAGDVINTLTEGWQKIQETAQAGNGKMVRQIDTLGVMVLDIQKNQQEVARLLRQQGFPMAGPLAQLPPPPPAAQPASPPPAPAPRAAEPASAQETGVAASSGFSSLMGGAGPAAAGTKTPAGGGFSSLM